MNEISKIKVNNTDYNIKSLPVINEFINTATGTTLQDNTIYRFKNVLHALSFNMPSITNNFYQSELVFKSGTTPTSLTYDNSIKWSGDDINDNVFVPVANKTYNIIFWYDGFDINAVVRGV